MRVANGTDPLPSDPPPPPPPPPATELFNGVTVSNISVGANGELKYQLVVPNGASNLLFAMYGGTGDADVYVRYGAPPTNSTFDCRPFSFGNNENCFFPAPRAGVWYVTISRWSGPMVPASDRMPSVRVQAGSPLKATEKSVPSTSAAETGVVPSVSNTRAVTWVGAASQVPPDAPFGNQFAGFGDELGVGMELHFDAHWGFARDDIQGELGSLLIAQRPLGVQFLKGVLLQAEGLHFFGWQVIPEEAGA